VPTNVVLIGDRKLCNQETMLAFCRMEQSFLAAHPWTDTAKAVWVRTWQRVASGKTGLERGGIRQSQRNAQIGRKSHSVSGCAKWNKRCWTSRSKKRIACVGWFSWSSRKAEQDAKHRQRALEEAEQALQRIARLLGRYDYTHRSLIQSRIDQALKKAHAQAYFHVT